MPFGWAFLSQAWIVFRIDPHDLKYQVSTFLLHVLLKNTLFWPCGFDATDSRETLSDSSWGKEPYILVLFYEDYFPVFWVKVCPWWGGDFLHTLWPFICISLQMHGYQHLFFPWIVYQLHIWGSITPWQPMLDAKPSVFSGSTCEGGVWCAACVTYLPAKGTGRGKIGRRPSRNNPDNTAANLEGEL